MGLQKEIGKIIFDLDDTLLFLSDKFFEIGDKFVEENNLDVSFIELFVAIGEMEKEKADTYITEDVLIDYLNSKLSINLDKDKCKRLLKEYANIPLVNVDDVRDILSYLSDKYELIAYTNWFTDNQILRLKLNGLEQYFSKVLGWDKLPVKPSNKGLDEIIRNDSLDNYIFIGDNIDMDIKIPSSIGMKTIFYNHKNIIQSDYKEIKNIQDLKNML